MRRLAATQELAIPKRIRHFEGGVQLRLGETSENIDFPFFFGIGLRIINRAKKKIIGIQIWQIIGQQDGHQFNVIDVYR